MPEDTVVEKKEARFTANLLNQKFQLSKYNCHCLLFLILQRYNNYLKSYSMITRTDPVIPSYNSLYKKHMVYLLVTATFLPLWM